MGENPQIIGLTGSFGSGCSYIAKEILTKKGYKCISLSQILKDRFRKSAKKDPDAAPRGKLQDFGDRERKQNGAGFYAEVALEQVAKVGGAGVGGKWAIDSIRNPKEVEVLRDYSRKFFLFGIYADKEVRWNRVKAGRYKGNRGQFDDDDKRDTGRESPSHGQRVEDCFSEADIVLSNDEDIAEKGNQAFEQLSDRVGRYVSLIEHPLQRQQPTEQEMLMGMAYAASQRSSCRKRKVGAVIVDSVGNILSSGYNEVPRGERPCTQEYNSCFRDRCRRDFIELVTSNFKGLHGKGLKIEELFKSHFRILDICRSLHAEENAIVNLARTGRSVSLNDCTLYTTTYPCRLCANKIAAVGLGHIVYVEPYPDPNAKLILKETHQEFFQGVTFKAYFRLYGEGK